MCVLFEEVGWVLFEGVRGGGLDHPRVSSPPTPPTRIARARTLIGTDFEFIASSN